MERGKTCYVSMPFGRKPHPVTGVLIDFDRLYHDVIKPAAEQAGTSVVRGDELAFGALIHKAVFEAVIGSDVFIADVTTGNSNVMYELGVRHALRQRATVLLMEGQGHLPYNISYSRTLTYRAAGDGGLEESEVQQMRSTLSNAIREGIRYQGNDSPLYEFFPELRVELPETMAPRFQRRPAPARKVEQNLWPGRDEGAQIKQAEEELRSAPEADPAELIGVLKRYRDISAWNDLIRFAEELPPETRESPQVQQIVALALNRRGQEGDQERAIGLMRELLEKTGGDSETLGILGRIYKDRFHRTEERRDLEHAIQFYRAGFEQQPSDYYPGINLVQLLLLYGDEAARQELAELVPRLRQAVTARLGDRPADYWELATAVHLAAIAHDWEEAARLAERMLEQAPVPWMVSTTVSQLDELRRVLDGKEADELDRLIGLIRSRGMQGLENSNA